MLKLNEHYIVDKDGKKSAVVIDIEDFKKIIKLLKKNEEIENYDTEEVTKDIIEAFKDLKKGKIHSAREILNEL